MGATLPRKVFDEEKLAILRKEYPKCKLSELAERLGVTMNTLRLKASRLGVKRARGGLSSTRWKPREDAANQTVAHRKGIHKRVDEIAAEFLVQVKQWQAEERAKRKSGRF
jgi:hypothetical protein